MSNNMQAIANFCQQAVADDRCSGAFGREVEQRLVDQQTEIERLREGGRYATVALGGAADDGEDGWSRENIRRLFEHVCEQWPELDPRQPERTR